MIENTTSAARIYNVVIVKRMGSHVSLNADGAEHSDAAQFESGMSSWVSNLERAQEQDFLFMWRDGRLFQAATVLGAERMPDRFGYDPNQTQTRFITSFGIPAFVESLLGQEFDFPNRNPIAYFTLHVDPVTGAAEIRA